MNKVRHSLSSIDRDAATAVCSQCGPVRIRVRTGGRGCECMTVRMRHRGKNRNRWKAPAARRKAQQYGMTETQVAELLAAQGGACAICRVVTDDIMIDHDHACCPGRYTCGACVRGILCRHCNLGLGFMKDDPSRLKAALRYLAS